MRLFWFIAGVAAVFGVSIGVYKVNSGGGFGFSNPAASGSYLLSAVFTLLGVVISVLVEALKSLPGDQRIVWTKFVDALARPRTFIALLFSPIAFFSLLTTLGEDVSTIAHYFAALQNGFFWDKLLSTVTNKVEDHA